METAIVGNNLQIYIAVILVSYKYIVSHKTLNWMARQLKTRNLFQIEEIKSKGGDEAQNVEELLQQQGHLIEEIFSHDDKDKDGYISHEEFSGPKHDEL